VQLAAQLRQSPKMEAIGQLAAGVAHDFNNILTVIFGYSRLLGEQTKGQEANYAREIENAAMRAAQLVRQLLTFARRHVSQATPTDVNDVLKDVTNMLKRLIGENIALELVLGSDLAPIVADRGMLEQAIMNLVVNARDAMPSGGRLTISTAAAEVTTDNLNRNPEARLGRCVCISVADTGCGMPPEILSRIFEPFFTTKEVGKGTGLGLSVVYGIAKQHNGWIDVRTEIGKGSVFELYLPEGVPTQLLKKTTPEAKQLHGHETILLVEDEYVVCQLMCHLLCSAGYNVIEASNGPEAIAIWEAHASEIDLLLTDLVMPGGMTGHELSLALVKQKPTLRVIYTSGYTVDVGTQEQFAGNFLPKPYRPQTLLETVRAVLETS
jgi:CheY-like chemotaxis protein